MAKRIQGLDLSILVQFTPYLIGGSYVVDPDNANDIDMLVHQYHYEDGKLAANLIDKHGFRTLKEGDEKYDEIDKIRLHEVFEGYIEDQKINVIIIGATFWPAYEGAVRRMQSRPDLYRTREHRIELHKGLCMQVAAIAQINLPESAA